MVWLAEPRDGSADAFFSGILIVGAHQTHDFIFEATVKQGCQARSA